MHKKKQFILIYSVSVPYVQMLFFISSNSIYHWPVLAVVKENVEFLLVRVIAIAYSYSFLFVVVVCVFVCYFCYFGGEEGGEYNFSVCPPLILQYYPLQYLISNYLLIGTKKW